MTEESQRVALVTGASRGIGAAIARRLAADGFAVVVNYAGSPDAAAEVVREIEQGGGAAVAQQADVSDPQAVAALFEAAERAYGGLDVLVNNAGVMSLAPLGEAGDAAFDRMMDINVRGTFNTLREAARRLRDGGRVINLSTTVLAMKLPTYGVYAATKGAVEAITPIFAKEMRGRQITANVVAPGPTATSLFFDGKTEAQVEQLAGMAPLERLGTPEDIAAAVAFLAGPDGAWINGQVLRANGGIG
jgi:3-oxoacyl-[acyl-carrier protein] reductase